MLIDKFVLSLQVKENTPRASSTSKWQPIGP